MVNTEWKVSYTSPCVEVWVRGSADDYGGHYGDDGDGDHGDSGRNKQWRERHR
jgi:hypothetical protein